MDPRLKSHTIVIAHAIEKDTDAVKQFLRNNGVAEAARLRKDQLQKTITTAMQRSRSFYDNFRAWALKRSGALNHAYLNDNGPDANGDGLPDILQGGSIASNSALATAASNSTAQTTPVAPPGFWSGVSLNSLLGFASSNFNTYAEVTKSKNEKDIVDAAIERERLQLATSGVTPPVTKSNTGMIVLGVVLGLATIGAILFFATKKKPA